jgi:uncharacterized protein (DUF2147 family)
MLALRVTAIAFLLMTAAGAAAQSPPPDLPPPPPLTPSNPTGGLWENPSGSVRVRIQLCELDVCGVVEWANEKALADAARGGNPDLIGMTLFSGLTKERDNVWRGRVFVPDINRHFSGTVTRMSESEARVRGCLAGRALCRSQTWRRVD